MHSHAQTVDDYVDAFGEPEGRVLLELRKMILAAAPQAIRSMKYRMLPRRPFVSRQPDR